MASIRPESHRDPSDVELQPVSSTGRSTSKAALALRKRVLDLNQRLQAVRRNFALILIYATVFMDFIGITLLSPGMRFMVDPRDPGAFYDFRHECVWVANSTATSLLDASASCHEAVMAPGKAISIMMFAYGVGQFISTPLMGVASDRFGHRKVLVASTVGTALTFALQGLLWSFWPHVGARFAGGLFSGSRPVCQSYIAASVPSHQRARMMGYVALSMMAALQVGPVLGGSLALVNLRLPLFVASAMAGVTALLLARYLVSPDSLSKAGTDRQASHPADHASAAGSRRLWQTRRLLLVQAGAAMFTTGSMIVCLPIMLADRFGLDPNAIGLLQWGDGLMLLLGNMLYQAIAARWGLPACAAVGALISSAQLAIPYAGDLLSLSAYRYVSMLGQPIQQPAAPAIASLVAPHDRMGAWMAAVSTAQTLVRALSPPLLGPLFDERPTVPFILTASATLLILPTAYLLKSRVPRLGQPPGPEDKGTAAQAAAQPGGGASPSASAVEVHCTRGKHRGRAVSVRAASLCVGVLRAGCPGREGWRGKPCSRPVAESGAAEAVGSGAASPGPGRSQRAGRLTRLALRRAGHPRRAVLAAPIGERFARAHRRRLVR